jgi:hypothetical protein
MHIGFAENRNKNNSNNFNNDKDNNSNSNKNFNDVNVNDNNSNDNTYNHNNNNNDNDNNARNNCSYISPVIRNNSNNNGDTNNNGINDGNAADNPNNESATGMILQQTNSYELSNYYEELLCRFESVQEKHVKYRLSTIQQVKLRTSPGDGTLKAGSGAGLFGDVGGEQGPAGSGTSSSVLFTEDF